MLFKETRSIQRRIDYESRACAQSNLVTLQMRYQTGDSRDMRDRIWAYIADASNTPVDSTPNDATSECDEERRSSQQNGSDTRGKGKSAMVNHVLASEKNFQKLIDTYAESDIPDVRELIKLMSGAKDRKERARRVDAFRVLLCEKYPELLKLFQLLKSYSHCKSVEAMILRPDDDNDDSAGDHNGAETDLWGHYF